MHIHRKLSELILEENSQNLINMGLVVGYGFKPLCEYLDFSPLGPAMKHLKRGCQGKWLLLGFYFLFCFLACYGSNKRKFLCIEEKVPCTTTFSLLSSCFLLLC